MKYREEKVLGGVMFLFIWACFPFTLYPDLHKWAGGSRTHTAPGQRWDWKLILGRVGVSLNSFFGSFPWVVPELNTLASVASVPNQPPTPSTHKRITRPTVHNKDKTESWCSDVQTQVLKCPIEQFTLFIDNNLTSTFVLYLVHII